MQHRERMKVTRPATERLLGSILQCRQSVNRINRRSVLDLINRQAGLSSSRLAEDLYFAQIADKKCSDTSPEQIVLLMRMREYRTSKSD